MADFHRIGGGERGDVTTIIIEFFLNKYLFDGIPM
jgi:hypothetical protein